MPKYNLSRKFKNVKLKLIIVKFNRIILIGSYEVIPELYSLVSYLRCAVVNR